MLLQVLSNVLKDAGYDVATANDGLEALYSINTFHITDNPFTVIVLDENLPKLNCFALSERLEHLNISMPMIIIKAKNNEGNNRLPAKENILFLETPIAKDELLSKIRILGSTGEPWDPESYQWFFEHVGGVTGCAKPKDFDLGALGAHP